MQVSEMQHALEVLARYGWKAHSGSSHATKEFDTPHGVKTAFAYVVDVDNSPQELGKATAWLEWKDRNVLSPAGVKWLLYDVGDVQSAFLHFNSHVDRLIAASDLGRK